MHWQLDPTRLVETAAALECRIAERFPDSGLGRVAAELHAVSRDAAGVANWLARPLYPLRILTTTAVLLLLSTVVWTLSSLRLELKASSLGDVVPLVESSVNDMAFIGVAVYFLLGIEGRVKRRRAIGALHVLRSLSHIVDMHQLTKDPERLLNPAQDTHSSPERSMTAFELTRYLDYCSEILALTAKLGALYIQSFDDADTVAAAGSIEALTVGLSQKIWQKIVILDRISGSSPVNTQAAP